MPVLHWKLYFWKKLTAPKMKNLNTPMSKTHFPWVHKSAQHLYTWLLIYLMKEDKRRHKRKHGKKTLEYSRIFIRATPLLTFQELLTIQNFLTWKQFLTRTFHQTTVGCSYHKIVFYSLHVIPWWLARLPDKAFTCVKCTLHKISQWGPITSVL